MKKLITLIILVTSTLVTPKEIEVIKFDNNQSPIINKEILIKELKNQFGEFDSSCMTRNLGWSPKLSESFLSSLRKAGATIPLRTGFDTSKYGIKYDMPYGCIGHLETSMHSVLEKQFKYYCEASKKGGIVESVKYINNLMKSTYDGFVFSCGIDSTQNSLAYRDAKDWYNQWTTGFNIWSEYMASESKQKYSIIEKRHLAKQKKQMAIKKAKEEQLAKQKIIDEENAKLYKIEEEKRLALQKIESAKRAEQNKLEQEQQRIAKEKTINDIKSGKSKLKSCDASIFNSSEGSYITLGNQLLVADNKSYIFNRMTLENKYNSKQMLFSYFGKGLILVNTSSNSYVNLHGLRQAQVCIIGTVTDIKKINGTTVTVIKADYIGKANND